MFVTKRSYLSICKKHLHMPTKQYSQHSEHSQRFSLLIAIKKYPNLYLYANTCLYLQTILSAVTAVVLLKLFCSVESTRKGTEHTKRVVQCL
jgi:hypothetical protein